jgi:uncharacterized protein
VRPLLAALALAVCASPAAAWQLSPPNTGEATAGVILTGRVVDGANLLPESAERLLTEKLAALEEATTDQMVVVTLESLRGASIEDVGFELGNRWGIGRADVDNGVLLIVAADEGRVRIEVGTGLEGLLTNERAAAIVDAMIPKFEAERPVEAIDTGVTEVDRLLRSDPGRPRYRSNAA